jgi:hypothetical protein
MNEKHISKGYAVAHLVEALPSIPDGVIGILH